LVGAAGYTKDPITGQGITDAFHSAEWCTEALDDALTGRRRYAEAMTECQRRRDAAVGPLYEFTTLEPPPEMQQLMTAIAGNQAAWTHSSACRRELSHRPRSSIPPTWPRYSPSLDQDAPLPGAKNASDPAGRR
jgi:hypothetical protein